MDAQKESGKVPHAGCYLLDFHTWRMCHAMDIVRKLIHGILCNERGAQFKLIDIKILPLYCIRLMLKSFSPVLCILAVPLLRVLLSLYSCSSRAVSRASRPGSYKNQQRALTKRSIESKFMREQGEDLQSFWKCNIYYHNLFRSCVPEGFQPNSI